MKNYPKKTIGELCNIVKGETGIASAIAGEYPLVVTAKERKTSATYQFDTQAVCIPLVSSSGHGKKSLNYVHYQEGKFALGTILAAVIPKNNHEISADFLHQYLLFYKDIKIVPLMRGAANVSLAVKDIAKIEIPLPPIDEQKDFIVFFNKLQKFNEDLVQEFDKQEKYVSQLKQAILQEAIAGQLTAEWRTQNPMQKDNPDTDAAALLAKIKAEKQQLIADGNLKKENILPEISPDKIPFILPNTWVWCPLGEVTHFIDYRGKTPTKITSGIRLITAKNVKQGYLSLSPDEYISEQEYEERMTRGYPQLGDVFFTTEAPLGNACLNNLDEPISMGQRIITIRSIAFLSSYLLKVILSPAIQKEIDIRKTGVTAQGIKSKRLVEVPFPLPPLAEQKAIVEKVDKLMNIIDQLEQQIKHRKQLAENLMQTVLREAFE
ncbi:MAG: restriction endonuclease subunit S [Pseudanabaena sp. M135S2SP2A07QC]|nr:restriction endonuclease subunit S [Pseudanabaena sp. M051S1SP2A07QC]MCA6527461.1 restriction endonuclease subunit S [Pseudanabaena sp. M179S2SP2A07QC]MCA6531179.1 restriction endonuclease subunit S [Pseudanabaena sp. M125S2SP2A07QC]MCA6535972.1 restriction endonuclease subunit S [Pseudanabaena sp. M176S2SP2A07QC]MCA6539962.1 restriction endonuclease subunit S [Pseudanabaena sp. M037S2SP2A07QC]MCA6542468.1 restriction endonuclease subunit S [Pseudanabaena sp. M074S1SP2A07QC]MCA6549866.1 re